MIAFTGNTVPITHDMLKNYYRFYMGIKGRGVYICDIMTTSEKISDSIIRELEEFALVKVIDLT